MVIDFRPMVKEDIPIYKIWAAKEHVRSVWFLDGYEPVDAIYSKVTGNGYDYPYIILLDKRPIGYMVTCDLYSYKKICPKPKGVFTDEPEGTYCIDLFIGEEDLLNKGYGTKIVSQFSEFLFREKGALCIVIDPDPNNERAVRCYEKAGFRQISKVYDGIQEAVRMERRLDR